MNLWEILVLGVVRLALDANYDRLEDMANNHKTLRGILGVELSNGFEGTQYSRQSIWDNVNFFDEELLQQINVLVVEAGHNLVKKKRRRRASYRLSSR